MPAQSCGVYISFPVKHDVECDGKQDDCSLDCLLS